MSISSTLDMLAALHHTMSGLSAAPLVYPVGAMMVPPARSPAHSPNVPVIGQLVLYCSLIDQFERAVVHDGVVREAEDGEVDPQGGGASGRGVGVVTGVESVRGVPQLGPCPGDM